MIGEFYMISKDDLDNQIEKLEKEIKESWGKMKANRLQGKLSSLKSIRKKSKYIKLEFK